ncbi:MAG TPA: hypothetical protein ENI58_03900 [Nitrospirae bacterium]|nr:hypothetical protein [Nitrospirota bacterium]
MDTDFRGRVLPVVVGLLFLSAIYTIFFYAPIESVMGIVQKIFYVHLSMAFTAFLSFFVAFICGILYLVKKDIKWDVYGASSVEIGVVFISLTLLSGVLWARPIWNTWWTWDPRLTTALILWFIYVSYLILRTSVDQEGKRATYCAVLAIVGFVDVPIVFMSARVWRSIHPVVIRSDSIDIAPSMLLTLVITMAAFFSLWFLLFRLKTSVALTCKRIRFLENRIEGGD